MLTQNKTYRNIGLIFLGNYVLKKLFYWKKIIKLSIKTYFNKKPYIYCI